MYMLRGTEHRIAIAAASGPWSKKAATTTLVSRRKKTPGRSWTDT
jgi:hypothetical protein